MLCLENCLHHQHLFCFKPCLHMRMVTGSQLRLNHGFSCGRCESWNWWAIVCQWISGFIMCTNAMMVVVGSATYLSVNRPESRSSVVRNTNLHIHLLTF